MTEGWRDVNSNAHKGTFTQASNANTPILVWASSDMVEGAIEIESVNNMSWTLDISL